MYAFLLTVFFIVLILCIKFTIKKTEALKEDFMYKRIFTGLEKEIKIPKIVHQVYFNVDRSDGLPFEYMKAISKMKSLNPDWEFKLYDLKDMYAYVKEYYPDIFPHFKRMNVKYGAAISDVFRYLVIYREGGVYFDVKSGCKIPLSEFIEEDDEYLIKKWNRDYWDKYSSTGRWGYHKEINTSDHREYIQWCIMSIPGHPIMEQVIKDVKNELITYDSNRVGRHGVLQTTGPIVYSNAVVKAMGTSKYREIPERDDNWQYYFVKSRKTTVIYKYTYYDLTEPIIFEDEK